MHHGNVSVDMEEYQLRFINNVSRVIDTNWLRRRPRIRILDMGCDTSGRQIAHLARLTRGEVVGINIPHNFPSFEAQAAAGPRTRLMRMDGTDLSFPDHSFDLVISANVLEHVRDPEKYISEAARVVKPTGIAYFETAPVWSGPRGHHIHPDMIAENCPNETGFRDDGTIVPDWSHLMASEDEMRAHLTARVEFETVDYILWYLFHSGDLNKTSWSRIQEYMQNAFPYVRASTWKTTDADTHSRPRDESEDYDVSGFSAICQKNVSNPISRRICWRLRKLGL